MTQACEALEKNFKMELQEGIASTSAMTSNVEAGAGQQSGHWELKFRRAKPSMQEGMVRLSSSKREGQSR